MNKQLLDDFKKVVKEHKYSMLELIIYYNLTCNDNFDKLSDDDVIYLIEFIYNAYVKDDNHTDLGDICDKAMEYSIDILKKNDNIFNTDDLLEKCYYEF